MDFDRRHNFIANFVYEIPKTHAKGLGQIADGWRFALPPPERSPQPSCRPDQLGNLLGTNNTGAYCGRPDQAQRDPYRQLTGRLTIPRWAPG